MSKFYETFSAIVQYKKQLNPILGISQNRNKNMY